MFKSRNGLISSMVDDETTVDDILELIPNSLIEEYMSDFDSEDNEEEIDEDDK